MDYGGLAPTPTPSPSPVARAPLANTEITAGQAFVAGLIVLGAGLFLLFITAGGPAAAGRRWAEFKVWLWRKVAYGLTILGALIILDSWIRS